MDRNKYSTNKDLSAMQTCNQRRFNTPVDAIVFFIFRITKTVDVTYA